MNENQPTITTRQQLITEITNARKTNNDSLAVHLYLLHGGTFDITFLQLTQIDPNRHAERLARLELARVPYDPDNPTRQLKDIRRKTDRESSRTATRKLYSFD